MTEKIEGTDVPDVERYVDLKTFAANLMGKKASGSAVIGFASVAAKHGIQWETNVIPFESRVKIVGINADGTLVDIAETLDSNKTVATVRLRETILTNFSFSDDTPVECHLVVMTAKKKTTKKVCLTYSDVVKFIKDSVLTPIEGKESIKISIDTVSHSRSDIAGDVVTSVQTSNSDIDVIKEAADSLKKNKK